MKKRILGLFLAIVTAMSLSCFNVSAADITDYTLEGYNNVQLSNGWAEVDLNNVTDENGIHTTTASKSGELGGGKRIATFQPWADGQGVGKNDGGKNYVMHFQYTVTEITDPMKLNFAYRNSSTSKDLITFSDSLVVWGNSLDESNTHIDVTLPYTIDVVMKTSDLVGKIYVNGQFLCEEWMTGRNDTQWREARIVSLNASNDIKLVTTKANSSIFTSAVTFEQVVDYVLNQYKTEEPDEPEEPEDEVVYEEGIKDLSDYTLSGINNKQMSNGWAEVDLNNVTDENGIHTTTATYSGELGSGKRIATFQPWADREGINSNASEHKILHYGFTVNEITSPLTLAHKYRDGATKYLISFSDNKVVVGQGMSGDTYVEVNAPYTINFFMNIKSCSGMIYVNDQLLYQGSLVNSGGDKKWQEVRVFSLESSNNLKLVTTKANSSLFSSDVAFSNVVDSVMNRDEAVKTNWIWKIEGFNQGKGNMQGAVDGVSSITGNNTDGYVLQPNSINASHYGFARFFLAQESGSALAKSDNDKVLWQSFEYNPTVLTEGQIFEIRGGNAYQTLLTAVPATETESAYLKANVDNSKICNLDSSKFYKIDFIVNNKDYEYYILVDGKVAAHNAIWDTRQPLWNTVFSSYTTDEKMTIKNMTTTLYESSISILDVVERASTSVYTAIENIVYDEDVKELTVTATMAGNSEAYEEALLIYVVYGADGKIVDMDCVETYSEDINATEFGRAYPYGILDVADVAEGEKLTVKAFVWNSVEGMKSLSSAAADSYTMPVAE